MTLARTWSVGLIGVRGALVEVEVDIANGVPGVALVGLPDAEWGERVSLAAELRPGASLTLQDVQEFARSRLAPYKIPRAFARVDALPRNAMGKVVKPDVARVFEHV